MPRTCDVKGPRVAFVMLITPCGGRVPICRFVLWLSGSLHRLGFSAPPPLDVCLTGLGGQLPRVRFFEAGLFPYRPLLWSLPQPGTEPRGISAVRDHRSLPRKSVSSCGVPEQRPKTLPSAPEEPRPLAVSGNSRGSFPPSVCRVLPKRAEKLRAAVLLDCWRRPQRHVGCSAR